MENFTDDGAYLLDEVFKKVLAISSCALTNLVLLYTVSLKPDLFEGFRFDFTKGLNPQFALSHR